MRPVFENPREYVLLSTRRLAQKLKVDSGTVVRIAAGMGFSGYHDLQHYLHELALSQATALEPMESSGKIESGMESHARHALDQNIRNIQRLRKSLEYDRIVALAKRIYRARRILLLGGDLASNLVEFLNYHLLILCLPSVTATTSGQTMNLTRSAGKLDLVLAISFRRCLAQTVEGLQQARGNGAYTVGITDTYISPIARYAHEYFLAPVEASFGISYAAPFSLLDGIVATCGFYDYNRNQAILKKVAEEQRKGSRWYREK
jgi:DNA-binding MurR/RpiR family transcriptional regulator